MIIHWLILSQRDKVLGSEMPWIRSRQTCFFLKAQRVGKICFFPNYSTAVCTVKTAIDNRHTATDIQTNTAHIKTGGRLDLTHRPKFANHYPIFIMTSYAYYLENYPHHCMTESLQFSQACQ